MTNAGPLALLLKDITSLCTEGIFYYHSAYYFGMILDKIWLWSMCQSKYAMPLVYIQGSHWVHFKKIENFLSPGDSTYFIFLESKFDSIFCPNIRFFILRVGCCRMEYLDIWSSCIMVYGTDWKHQIFMPSVTTWVQQLQWFGLLMASYLVDFLIGSKNFKISEIEVFQIIWQLVFWWDNIVAQNKGINRQLPVIIKRYSPKWGSKKL